MDEYQNNPTEEPIEGDEVFEQAEDLGPIEGDEVVEPAEDLEPIEDQEPIEDDADTEPADDALEDVVAVEREVDPELLAQAEWFVVHSYSGYENKVQRNLEQRIESMGMKDKIFRVVVPTEEEVEIREGQRRSSRKRVFPGYILVQMILDEESWYVVRNTPGVTGFVGTGTRPSPLSVEEVDKILSRMEAEQPRIKVSFRVGETVRITEGPFADFMAVVDELYPERGKVRVLVSFFGRETPVEMDFMQVERI
jgi:transcriptional antiterminator NusG